MSISVFSIFTDNATQDDKLDERIHKYMSVDVVVSIIELQFKCVVICSRGAFYESSFHSAYYYDFV